MPKFPYANVISAVQPVIEKLRKKFPDTIDASYLKKIEIAPNNESYIINTLKFIGVLNNDGNRNENNYKVFLADDDGFKEGFAQIIEEAYKQLFDIHGDDAWNIDRSKIVSLIRNEDKSSDLIGRRQADTFIRLAEISGKRKPTNGEPGIENQKNSKSQPSKKKQEKFNMVESKIEIPFSEHRETKKQQEKHLTGDVSLAVRIEVNLPASSDQAVYDAIFKSIRENLINRE
jgi:hypothetical protein